MINDSSLDHWLCKTDWTPEDDQAALALPRESRIFLASNISYYDGILIDLSLDGEEAVRLGVAGNKHSPRTVLQRLANEDTSTEVRRQALLILKEIAYD